MGHRFGIAALAAAAALPASTSAAPAREVRFPAAHPEFSMRVPDDWSVSETPLGLELQSPQKDALVLAGMSAGDRRSVDAWSKRALERMSREGVVFAKKGPAKPATARVAGPSDAAPAKDTLSKDAPKDATPPAVRPTEATSALARRNGDLPYTFGGAPMVDPLKSTESKAAPAAGIGAMDLPSISTEGANPGAMKPSGHFAYAGGTMRGQPVDVELAVFPLGKDKRLLIEQQSGPTDARGVMIVRSLRDLTQ